MSARPFLLLRALGLAALLGLFAPTADAKRKAPEPVKPVTAGKIEYRALHERYKGNKSLGGLRAYVEARNTRTKKALWKVKIYDIPYKADLETDVQDVHINSLKLEKRGLLVGTEKGKTYLVDLTKKTVRELKKPAR
jgi:hypothetical protein